MSCRWRRSGVQILALDFLDRDGAGSDQPALGGPADVVLSDMAAPATGHAATDHLRIMALVEAAYEFAVTALSPGGTFVAKVYQGGTEAALLERLKRDFASVRHAKPPASRAEFGRGLCRGAGLPRRRLGLRRPRFPWWRGAV